MNLLVMHTDSRGYDNLNYKVVASLSNDNAQSCPFYDDMRIEKIENFDDTYTLSVPEDRQEAQLLVNGAFILFEDESEKHRLFRIYSESSKAIGNIHSKTVDSENAFINDLNKTIVSKAKLINVNFAEAMSHILALSGWEIGNVEWLGEIRSLVFDGTTNAQEELQNLINTYRGEIDAYVKVRNGRIVGKYFDLVEKRGRDNTGRRFEYRRDIKGVTRTKVDTELYTAIKARGKDGLSFASINNGLDTLYDVEANEIYNDGREYLVKYFEYETEYPSALLAATREELNRVNHPIYNYEVEPALLDETTGYDEGPVLLGDSVRVVDFAMQPEMTVSARVIEKQTSYSNVGANTVVLGEYVELDNDVPGLIQKLQSQLTDVSKNINPVYRLEIFSSNGIVIKNGVGNTQLTARVYKDNMRIFGEPHQYKWEKILPNGTHDTEWEMANEGVGQTIYCDAIDFVNNVSYKCSYLTDEYNYVATAYFKTEVDRVIGEVNKLRTANSIVIPFITDTHYATDAFEDQQAKLRSLYHINNVVEVTHQINCDVVVHGGDIVDGKTSNYLNKANLKTVVDALNESDCPVMFAKGNHDDNGLGDVRTAGNQMTACTKPAEMKPILSKKYIKSNIVFSSTDNANYCYYDIKDKKVRVFVLDSYDLRYDLLGSDKKNKYQSRKYGAYQKDQINWLIEQLKNTPKDYKILTFHHYAMYGAASQEDTPIINSEIVAGIFNAWQNGTSYSGNGTNSDFAVTVNVDFSTRGKGIWLAAFNGHWHSDKAKREGLGNVPTIMSICSLGARDNDGNDRTLGATVEDGWDVIVVDLDTNMINLVRFGANAMNKPVRTYSGGVS
ncbi:phage tail spike protein [Rummeliibacillus stabekisii]|uniref:Calcineurin-like phosphoesterase domain-containing protein n=1 Tax=Rummeliibacillus stabekisii TaxID=241244 RepID=A0A143HD76_9BACL|nr:phage tail spike protein [Rummeliibacillus stabekisii]AMW99201.1 hypothetical protein ATY39_06825 [Rummeliibacillus stabekisii]